MSHIVTAGLACSLVLVALPAAARVDPAWVRPLPAVTILGEFGDEPSCWAAADHHGGQLGVTVWCTPSGPGRFLLEEISSLDR